MFFCYESTSSALFLLAIQEYINLYTDWLLNSSIAKNFDAFKKGFDLVMSQVPLADLFTAEEVELLVCGSNVSVCKCVGWREREREMDDL